jgi:hypothetical protein
MNIKQKVKCSSANGSKMFFVAELLTNVLEVKKGTLR